MLAVMVKWVIHSVAVADIVGQVLGLWCSDRGPACNSSQGICSKK